MSDCPFCERIAKGYYDRLGPDVVGFVPLNPVTPGHYLVVSEQHVEDAATDPAVTARTIEAACRLIAPVGPCNLIANIGEEATQSVFHLHWHVVPRREGDGLCLPWTGQKRAEAS